MLHGNVFGPMCLHACLATMGHAPNETTGGVLGDLLPGGCAQGLLEQGCEM